MRACVQCHSCRRRHCLHTHAYQQNLFFVFGFAFNMHPQPAHSPSCTPCIGGRSRFAKPPADDKPRLSGRTFMHTPCLGEAHGMVGWAPLCVAVFGEPPFIQRPDLSSHAGTYLGLFAPSWPFLSLSKRRGPLPSSQVTRSRGTMFSHSLPAADERPWQLLQ